VIKDLQAVWRHAREHGAIGASPEKDVQTRRYGIVAKGRGAISFILPYLSIR